MDIAEQDRKRGEPPTGVRVAFSQFLSSVNRSHVIGVSLLSRIGLRVVGAKHVQSDGAAYYFPRTECPFWHAEFETIFRAGQ